MRARTCIYVGSGGGGALLNGRVDLLGGVSGGMHGWDREGGRGGGGACTLRATFFALRCGAQRIAVIVWPCLAAPTAFVSRLSKKKKLPLLLGGDP
jgi:hypothetical protein